MPAACVGRGDWNKTGTSGRCFGLSSSLLDPQLTCEHIPHICCRCGTGMGTSGL